MRTTFVLVALTGVAFVLGRSTADRRHAGRHHSAYQRAALVWTSPIAVRVRRTVRKRTRGARGRLHR